MKFGRIPSTPVPIIGEAKQPLEMEKVVIAKLTPRQWAAFNYQLGVREAFDSPSPPRLAYLIGKAEALLWMEIHKENGLIQGTNYQINHEDGTVFQLIPKGQAPKPSTNPSGIPPQENL